MVDYEELTWAESMAEQKVLMKAVLWGIVLVVM